MNFFIKKSNGKTIIPGKSCKSMYKVILYYNFHNITNPLDFRTEQKEFCKSHRLKGRIYVSEEGINGTLAGKPEDILAYEKYLQSFDGFESTEFKEDDSEFIPFAKLIVKIRSEIVSLKAPMPINPAEGGKTPDAGRLA